MPGVPRIAVVGNLSRDRVDGAPPRVGGPPFYAGRALHVLGHPAAIAVKFAEIHRNELLPALVALGLPVFWRPALSTATYAFSYDGDVRSMAVEELGEPWAPEDLHGWAAEALRGADWVHVGALAQGEFSPETLAALAAGGERRLSFDGQGLVRPARTGPLELDPQTDPDVLRHVTVLKLSEEEAQALVGSLEEGALAELGPPEVIVTLGSRGSIVVAGGELVQVPARPLEDVDPTGAGDAFAASYVVARSRGFQPLAAARRATSVVAAVLAGR
jgi:sugar/nucleoside kinase (ribokinase family)